MSASTSIRFLLLFTALAGATVLGGGVPITKSRDSKKNNKPQISDMGRRAEETLQEALNLAVTEDPALARERLTKAMQLWLQMSEPDSAARAALRMGDLFRDARKYQDSLDCYERALDIRLLGGQTLVTVSNSIAKVYGDLYQRDLSYAYYDRAIKLAKEISDNTGRSKSLAGLADLYYREGNTNQALASIAQARRLALAKLDDGDAAHMAHLIGEIDKDKGLLDRARQAFAEALTIYAKIGDEEEQIDVLCSISNLELLSAHVQLAVKQSDRATDWAEKRGTRATNNGEATRAREVRWKAWLSRARAYRAIGDNETAILSYGWAIYHLEGLYWLVYVTTENSAVAFREELQAPYRELVDLLIEVGRVPEALERTEHARARVMMGITEARRIAGSRTGVDEKGSLRPLSESIARLRIQLGSFQIAPARRARLEEQMKNTREALLEGRTKLEMQRSRKHIGWVRLLSVKQLQERLLDTGEIIVEFALGQSRSFAWVVSSQAVSLEILPGKSNIERHVRDFIERLATPPNNMFLERDLSTIKEQGRDLLSILFGKLYDQIPSGRKLIIVPDGLLYDLPFEALLRGDRYLIEDHEMSYVSSASMLNLWPDSQARNGSDDQMELLAFGDPKFGTVAVKSRRRRSAPRYDVLKGARASSVFNLPPLPRTRDEVEDIASLFPSDRRRFYLGRDSTEYALKHEQLQKYRRLHLATHSLLNETFPSRSAVVLTPDRAFKEDGFLEVEEIADLNLDCDLVVLSACQTARGQLLSGEGVLGLTRSFLYAGARSVVVSEWSVSDISTGQLMKDFYQNIVNKVGYAAALRSAKLQALLSKTEVRHPYYWASFILIGKP